MLLLVLLTFNKAEMIKAISIAINGILNYKQSFIQQLTIQFFLQ